MRWLVFEGCPIAYGIKSGSKVGMLACRDGKHRPLRAPQRTRTPFASAPTLALVRHEWFGGGIVNLPKRYQLALGAGQHKCTTEPIDTFSDIQGTQRRFAGG